MCVWKVNEKHRMCQFCNYRGGCERYPVSGRHGIEADGERMLKIMNGIVGDDVRKKRRSPRYLWGRYIVAHHLRVMGYSYPEIAGVLGLTHAAIINSESQVTKMLQMPQMYKFEKDLLDAFGEKLNSL